MPARMLLKRQLDFCITGSLSISGPRRLLLPFSPAIRQSRAPVIASSGATRQSPNPRLALLSATTRISSPKNAEIGFVSHLVYTARPYLGFL
jgi:hypothetical protein